MNPVAGPVSELQFPHSAVRYFRPLLVGGHETEEESQKGNYSLGFSAVLLPAPVTALSHSLFLLSSSIESAHQHFLREV